MPELKWFEKLLKSIIRLLPWRDTRVDIYVLDREEWVKVDGPTSFSKLNELFGDDNWKL